MTRLLAIPLLLLGGCIQTGVNALDGQSYVSETLMIALHIERGSRDSSDHTRRVVLCEWDDEVFGEGTYYGTYDGELGTIAFDDAPEVGVSWRRAAQIELQELTDQGDASPYNRVPSWKIATKDAPFGACGAVCDPAGRASVVTEWIDGASTVQTKQDCRDYCMAAAGEWLDCMHEPDRGDGGYCDCTDVTW